MTFLVPTPSMPLPRAAEVKSAASWRRHSIGRDGKGVHRRLPLRFLLLSVLSGLIGCLRWPSEAGAGPLRLDGAKRRKATARRPEAFKTDLSTASNYPPLKVQLLFKFRFVGKIFSYNQLLDRDKCDQTGGYRGLNGRQDATKGAECCDQTGGLPRYD